MTTPDTNEAQGEGGAEVAQSAKPAIIWPKNEAAKRVMANVLGWLGEADVPGNDRAFYTKTALDFCINYLYALPAEALESEYKTRIAELEAALKASEEKQKAVLNAVCSVVNWEHGEGDNNPKYSADFNAGFDCAIQKWIAPLEQELKDDARACFEEWSADYRSFLDAQEKLGTAELMLAEFAAHSREQRDALKAKDEEADATNQSLLVLHNWFQDQDNEILLRYWGSDVCKVAAEILTEQNAEIATYQTTQEALLRDLEEARVENERLKKKIPARQRDHGTAYCSGCKQIFQKKRPDQVYCSERCRDRVAMRRVRARIKAATIPSAAQESKV